LVIVTRTIRLSGGDTDLARGWVLLLRIGPEARFLAILAAPSWSGNDLFSSHGVVPPDARRFIDVERPGD
jgi:hypothetical protein